MLCDQIPQRCVILYVTLDPWDHRKADGALAGHAANLAGLRAIVERYSPGLVIRDCWAPRLTPSMLMDPHLLALVLAGSYTEWVEAFRQLTWAAQLDDYAALIRGTDMPILAICGSHQFLAYVYAGWRAVGHMAHAGTPPVAVADEVDGIFRAPNPRIGEVGVYACRAVHDDPILEGLPEVSHFVEYHHDQVLASALPPKTIPLLEPHGLAGARQRPAYAMAETEVMPGQPRVAYTHAPLALPTERCQVQMLRYHVPPAGRLLYAVQFHPELSAMTALGYVAPQADADGQRLIANFLRLAKAYWLRH